jgi:peroxiredoxin
VKISVNKMSPQSLASARERCSIGHKLREGNQMDRVLLWFACGLGLVTILTLWTVLFQVVRQQGRLLLRLDTAELQLARVEQGQASLAAAANGGMSRNATAERVGPARVAVGTPLPPFRLPSLGGESVGLADLRGKRVLLVNWNPGCGFCEQIAPDLAELQPDLRRRQTELVLVAHSDAESNRLLSDRHSLRCSILLQEHSDTIEAFRGLGTPAAYLLDEEGRVDEPLAVGAIEVPALAQRAAHGRKRLGSERTLDESRIERSGLSAGSRAPSFALPDLAGTTVSLDDYLGRKVLLVFVDPHCGPCDGLAPQLVHLHEENRADGMVVMLVGRGDLEENRSKAEQSGIDFPYVLQERWKLSKQYGIFATPVGFLIDEQGMIAHEVAVGPDQIIALAREQRGSERVALR